MKRKKAKEKGIKWRSQANNVYSDEINKSTTNVANAQRDGRPVIGGALCSTPQSLADAHY